VGSDWFWPDVAAEAKPSLTIGGIRTQKVDDADEKDNTTIRPLSSAPSRFLGTTSTLRPITVSQCIICICGRSPNPIRSGHVQPRAFSSPARHRDAGAVGGPAHSFGSHLRRGSVCKESSSRSRSYNPLISGRSLPVCISWGCAIHRCSKAIDLGGLTGHKAVLAIQYLGCNGGHWFLATCRKLKATSMASHVKQKCHM
jgi:hypothetical protein